MIRQVLYTLLIMGALGLVLVFGLYGPPVGKNVVQSTREFLQWAPETAQGPLDETEAMIKQFTNSFRTVRDIRTMVVDRNKKSTQDLDVTYQEVRKNLKQLLFEMNMQSVSNRTKLLEQFGVLHHHRQQLVERLINDERTLIKLNDQMDTQLREISSWLSAQALKPPSPTLDEKARATQYENLLKDLQTFTNESNQLDVLRIVLMRKSQAFVDSLEVSNMKLEENFKTFSGQVQVATSEQGTALWEKYELLEKEQREIVQGMRLNQEFIGKNQQQIVTGVETVASNIRYRTDNQLERFQQNYEELEKKRAGALEELQAQQSIFMNERATMDEMKASNEYRAEMVKERTSQLLTQYERLEEYRRSMSSALEGMTEEIRDNEQFQNQRIEEMRLSLQEKIQSNKNTAEALDARQKMDDAIERNQDRIEQMKLSQSNRDPLDTSDASQKIDDAMTRSQDQIQQLRDKMEATETKLKDMVKKDLAPLANNPYYIRVKELQERNRVAFQQLQQGEDQLRSAQERQRAAAAALRDRISSFKDTGASNSKSGGGLLRSSSSESQKAVADSLKERIEDATTKNKDMARSMREKAEEQQRSQRDRARDQAQRMRDQRN
jgi:hypothetical protein